jgi:hypothetical protein
MRQSCCPKNPGAFLILRDGSLRGEFESQRCGRHVKLTGIQGLWGCGSGRCKLLILDYLGDDPQDYSGCGIVGLWKR